MLDYKSAYRLIDHVIRGGVHGIILLGSTGEFSSLPHPRADDAAREPELPAALAIMGVEMPRPSEPA